MADTDNGAQVNLAALRLPELRKIAADLGLKGTSALRKGDLITAISGAQTGGVSGGEPRRRRATKTMQSDNTQGASATEAPAENTIESVPENSEKTGASAPKNTNSRRRRVTRTSVNTAEDVEKQTTTDVLGDTTTENTQTTEESTESDHIRVNESRSAARRARRNRVRREYRENNGDARTEGDATETVTESVDKNGSSGEAAEFISEQPRERRGRRRSERLDRNNEGSQDANTDESVEKSEQSREEKDTSRTERDNDSRNDRGNRRDYNDRGNRRNRRNRRGREERDNNDGREYEAREDDVLQDVAGILDIVDKNVAFVRTTGYHSSQQDVHVNPQMVRRLGLRSGDAIIGKARVNDNSNQRGRGRNHHRFNPLVKVEKVNGIPVEEAKERPHFSKLTPLYPNQRLRLETDPKILTTRVIDLIMPIGKGQRALIVSPPKAGKTTILQNIANAIAINNPECYLMVVLVDERPEEVTDMQRSVKGEVIASTFDRPPSEHTTVAELAIERAKRLVEQGQDVVVLLDSITRLGRAYNNSSPASGRILSGGVDSNALCPPKRFLGAARNIENGGSLTIIATAMVETGSAGDTVIFEEFKGTGNAELKLDRRISERRVFPAVDVNPSGTRKDELLLAPEEARVMHKLRRILSALDSQAAIDLLIKQLKKTKNNGEFLMQVMSSAPMAEEAEED
ncbi:Transcription termination factor Rho [Corynebacterium kutscheri]|uniref:transcription termination factor Rho n=1 Tax=Corynebacterium kutscheri TaxID=35755 RepID=UPI000F6BBBCE|nr:transcription termination factor Rho [Corynebacterium kutscheri]VEH80055.1 Transcription termination factor Rho [Corynebacterium kutscheri]